MDCIVHVVTKRQTRLSDFHFPFTLTNTESLCCTPETNVMLYAKYTTIKKTCLYYYLNTSFDFRQKLVFVYVFFLFHQ